MDTPLGTTAGYSLAIFEIRPLSRATGVGLRYPQIKKIPVARLRGQISKIAPEYPAVVPRGVSMRKMGSVRQLVWAGGLIVHLGGPHLIN